MKTVETRGEIMDKIIFALPHMTDEQLLKVLGCVKELRKRKPRGAAAKNREKESGISQDIRGH